jgi:plastocyanin
MNKFLVLALFAAACGGGDDASDSTKAVDAAKAVDAKKAADGAVAVDAAPATVTKVDCATVTPVATVSTVQDAYSPSASTINQNDVVKFVMPSEHNVAPDSTGNTDAGLVVDFNETACLKFTAKGTFKFKCTVHGFTGTVTAN